MNNRVAIVAAKRTPIGAFQGSLSHLKSPELGSAVITALLEETSVNPSDLSEVILGCVLSAGVGQAPARQAALGAKSPNSVPCTTVNKVCGSGMKALMLGCDHILLNQDAIVIAGGMESMTNSPYILDRARSGYRLGHNRLIDHMWIDGLEDAYQINPDKSRRLMGDFAEATAKRFDFTREDQDKYVHETWARAIQAQNTNAFANEIVVTPNAATDDIPAKIKPEKIIALKPVFSADGTITAASSSAIADGAAAALLMSENQAAQQGLFPLAFIKGHTTFAHEPEWFTTAPIGAIANLCKKVGWSIDEVDLFEINEAFAVVTMAAMKELKIPHEKVNVNGGACVLGHPLGASGARIVVTLIHAMINRNAKKGIAAICLGGGEATAIAIERS